MFCRSAVRFCLAAALALAAVCPALADLGPQQVLLIVNENSPDSLAIRDAYLAKYPGVHVWSYAGTTDATITRAAFESELRVPLDTYLRTTEFNGEPLYKQIRVLVTTKGVPRRIDDFDTPGYGDLPNMMLAEYSAGRFDAAAVDSDLAMLHQPLMAGITPEPWNYANNHVRNPYHAATQRIDTYARDNATTTKSALTYVTIRSGWENGKGSPAEKLTSGDIYLVARLTGYTAAEAIAALNRGGTIPIVRQGVTFVIDRDDQSLDDDAPYSQGVDFPEARDVLTAAGFSVIYDETDAVFVTTAPLPVLGYAGYGRNHNPFTVPATYVLTWLSFSLSPGAVFNTYESFNGRYWEDWRPHDTLGQAADWIRIGGTLALAHVWEPLTFSVADNEILYDRMLNRGWTFVEAAYASLPVLSWQNIVVGDPLTRFEVRDAGPPLIQASTDDDRRWVYQNIPASLANGGHRVGLTATVLDLNGNTGVTFTARKQPGSGTGEVDIVAEAGLGRWTLYGSDYALGAWGPLVIEIICQGNLCPTPTVVAVPMTCVKLGDIDANGGAEPTDMSLLVNRLNGMATPAEIDPLRFDLDRNGGAEPGDLSLLVVILNGML